GASNDYISTARPLTDQSSAVGAVTVSTDANTYSNVDGTAYTGASGLAAMAALTTNAPVAAYGTLGDLSGVTPGFHATAVYAGTSLETLSDHVTGVVSARSGNTLTVHGARLFQRLGAACAAYPDAFYNNATVTIGNATPAGLNFAGTGSPAANPAAYAVNTGTLDESGVAASTLLAVDGLVSPFGAAPPDFHATAIALGTATEQRLVVEWVNGG